MKTQIEKLLQQAAAALGEDVLPPGSIPASIPVEHTRDPSHGDFASNLALMLAKAARMTPRLLAEQLVAALPASDIVDRVEIAGPGFINFHVSAGASGDLLQRILEQGEAYGRSNKGAGTRVLVEFVSANPTGPLHVGHGRGAAYGATIANLLEAMGHEVGREYYVNDAGRQIDILAASVWLRYLEQLGQPLPFPSNGYRGDYVADIAAQLRESVGGRLARSAGEVLDGLPPDAPEGDKEAHVDALIGRARDLLCDEYQLLARTALDIILADIKDDLTEFGVRFDEWFSERRLVDEGLIDHALDKLESNDQVYRKDGARWFRASAFGDDKDRVIVRENGQATYIASDVAYHLNKRERGYDRLLDVLGADHHGYVARIRAGLEAIGEPGDSLEVRLVQFVALFRGHEKVQMSTRAGDFVTLRELREEVGNDAARFFYVSRSNDQHLDFDLELAKAHSADNPVYYVQYAHARVCSVFRKLGERDWQWTRPDTAASLSRLVEPQEQALIRSLGRYPEVVGMAADRRAPQQLVNYLRDLANEFHTCYNAHKVLIDDAPLRDAWLTLCEATRQVIANGLGLLGVSAPESM
jgi:arginyl-tRNA synthetase